MSDYKKIQSIDALAELKRVFKENPDLLKDPTLADTWKQAQKGTPWAIANIGIYIENGQMGLNRDLFAKTDKYSTVTNDSEPLIYELYRQAYDDGNGAKWIKGKLDNAQSRLSKTAFDPLPKPPTKPIQEGTITYSSEWNYTNKQTNFNYKSTEGFDQTLEPGNSIEIVIEGSKTTKGYTFTYTNDTNAPINQDDILKEAMESGDLTNYENWGDYFHQSNQWQSDRHAEELRSTKKSLDAELTGKFGKTATLLEKGPGKKIAIEEFIKVLPDTGQSAPGITK